MIAVDTNVLIYACDQADPRRQKIAFDLITDTQDGVLLWQVACEFLSASRKLSKQGFTPTDAWNRLAEYMDLLPLVLPSDANLVLAKALHLARGYWNSRWRPAVRRSLPITSMTSERSTALASRSGRPSIS